MPPSSTKRFSGIFISYRRDDTAGHAGRLSDKLVDYFGKDQIFMDIDTIQPGEDFVQVIENAVGSCEILIAIIGRNWLRVPGETSKRLDNLNDFVRLEIAAALNRDIRVIPVLVQRATMPKPQDLPDELSRLARRNALELTDTRWQRDVDQLINAIEKILDEQARRRATGRTGSQPELIPRPPRRLLLVATTFIALILIVIAVVLFRGKLGWTTRQHDEESANTPSVNANTSSATKGSQSQTQNNSPVAPERMVYVPGGEFRMGRDDGDEYERPAHQVMVRPFFIDQYEVENSEYQNLRLMTGHERRPELKAEFAESLPVTGVTWDDANEYCKKTGKRLPTEEEWEFAARGRDGRLYPWGNDWGSGLANAAGASNGMVPGGTYKGKSPFGAYDMVGNAWEWTASTLTPYSGGSLPAESAGANLRVIRGGTYASTSNKATTTYRRGWPATGANDYSNTGFRCVQDVKR